MQMWIDSGPSRLSAAYQVILAWGANVCGEFPPRLTGWQSGHLERSGGTPGTTVGGPGSISAFQDSVRLPKVCCMADDPSSPIPEPQIDPQSYTMSCAPEHVEIIHIETYSIYSGQ